MLQKFSVTSLPSARVVFIWCLISDSKLSQARKRTRNLFCHLAKRQERSCKCGSVRSGVQAICNGRGAKICSSCGGQNVFAVAGNHPRTLLLRPQNRPLNPKGHRFEAGERVLSIRAQGWCLVLPANVAGKPLRHPTGDEKRRPVFSAASVSMSAKTRCATAQ